MLTDLQHCQVASQILAYKKLGRHTVEVPLGPRQWFSLDIHEFIASPKVMNSGLHIVNHLVDHPEIVKGKSVLDMGTGSGIIGIAAAHLGAHAVAMTDIDPRAVACAEKNVIDNGVELVCSCKLSDLFIHMPEMFHYGADVVIFNHPFFAGTPKKSEEWTRMMMAETDLLERFFAQVPLFMKPGGLVIMPWLPMASSNEYPDNDPARHAQNFGFSLVTEASSPVVNMGIQRSEFVIYEFSPT